MDGRGSYSGLLETRYDWSTTGKIDHNCLVEVTTYFHQTNFATEFLADAAISRAKELDDIFRKTGKIVGPLHGVSVSVKEHIGVKGRICNAGYVAWCDYVSPDDAFVLQLLQNAGAIAIVRTNEPQSLMVCIDSSTHAYLLERGVSAAYIRFAQSI